MSQNKLLRQYEVYNFAIKEEGMELRFRDNYSKRAFALPELAISDEKFIAAFNAFKTDVNAVCEMDLDPEDVFLIQPTQVIFSYSLKHGLQIQIEAIKKLAESGDAWKIKTPKRFEKHRMKELKIAESFFARIENFKDQANRIIRDGNLVQVAKVAEQPLLFNRNDAA
ncbi:hypothetical protein [Leptospira santarosai]|uniref:hypothetical protein n=1 Tax=Leptospira santarosai TaxID=28183 RepID=UPI0002BD7F8F|nr:hypothetical protein [Leptospira santarosai]EMO12499.1 hypothetical protein LEP1GSC165_0020 [Leptospira santarosai str. CBC523]MDI7183637.1 hypothetical protein [Leptospira santarosai]